MNFFEERATEQERKIAALEKRLEELEKQFQELLLSRRVDAVGRTLTDPQKGNHW